MSGSSSAENIEVVPPQKPPTMAVPDSNSNSELKTMFAESQDKIRSAQIEPPKMKAGRKMLPRDEHGNKIRPGDSRFEPALAAMAKNPPQAKPAEPPGEDLCKFLVDPLIGLSQIPAAKHGVPELALVREEAVAICSSGQAAIDAWFPDYSKLDPKIATILAFGGTCTAIFVSKVEILKIKNEEKRIAARNPDVINNNNSSETPPQPPPNFGPQKSALEHFKN